ncbi:hypothetical protein AYI68_g8243 [Smittium mucronatum]|uniref:Uncharacterized protein n=1 Tax=Smittium mucronatum TaxID=133383 RepID=A0A1R0GLF3_9FUNG|nr:hypothetical protein AYI68_g8243 [Smittium mucronatum]
MPLASSVSSSEKFRISGLDKSFILEKIEIRSLYTLFPFEISNLTSSELSLQFTADPIDVVLFQESNPNWNTLSQSEKDTYLNYRELFVNSSGPLPLKCSDPFYNSLSFFNGNTTIGPSSQSPLPDDYTSHSSNSIQKNDSLNPSIPSSPSQVSDSSPEQNDINFLPKFAISASTRPQRRFMQMFNEGPFIDSIDLGPFETKTLFLIINSSKSSLAQKYLFPCKIDHSNNLSFISPDSIPSKNSFEDPKQGISQFTRTSISSHSSSSLNNAAPNSYFLPCSISFTQFSKDLTNYNLNQEISFQNFDYLSLDFFIELGFKKLVSFHDSPHINFFNCVPNSSYYKDITIKNDSIISLEWNAFLSSFKLSSEKDTSITSKTIDEKSDSYLHLDQVTHHNPENVDLNLLEIPHIKLVGLDGVEKSFGTLEPFQSDTIRVVYTTQHEDQFKCKLTIEDLDFRSEKLEWSIYGKMKSLLGPRRLELLSDKVIDFGTCASGLWTKKHLVFKNNHDQNLSVSFKIEGDVADIEFQSLIESLDDKSSILEQSHFGSNDDISFNYDPMFSSIIPSNNNSISSHISNNSAAEPNRLQFDLENFHSNLNKQKDFGKPISFNLNPLPSSDNGLTLKKLAHYFNQQNKTSQILPENSTPNPNSDPNFPILDDPTSLTPDFNVKNSSYFLKNSNFDHLSEGISSFTSNSFSALPSKNSFLLRNSSIIDSEEKKSLATSSQMPPRDHNNRKNSDDLILKPGSTKGINIMILKTIKNTRPDQELGSISRRSFTLECKYGNLSSNSLVTRVSTLSIPCIANFCTSLISVKNDVIDTGPISVGNVKSVDLVVQNMSDIESQFRCSLDSKIINCNHLPVKIPPRGSVNMRIDIYPRRVNSRYRKQINIVNLKNRNQPDLIVNVKSQHIDPGRMSYHNLLYKTLLNNREQNFIDFGVAPINSPIFKIMEIKNVCDEQIEIEFSSENSQSLNIYSLCGINGIDIDIPFNSNNLENQTDKNPILIEDYIISSDMVFPKLESLKVDPIVIENSLKFMDLLKQLNIHGVREKFKELISESKNSNGSFKKTPNSNFSAHPNEKSNHFERIFKTRKQSIDDLDGALRSYRESYPADQTVLSDLSSIDNLKPNLDFSSNSSSVVPASPFIPSSKRLSLNNTLNHPTPGSIIPQLNDDLDYSVSNYPKKDLNENFSSLINKITDFINVNRKDHALSTPIPNLPIISDSKPYLPDKPLKYQIELENIHNRLFKFKKHSVLVPSKQELRRVIRDASYAGSFDILFNQSLDSRLSSKFFLPKNSGEIISLNNLIIPINQSTPRLKPNNFENLIDKSLKNITSEPSEFINSGISSSIIDSNNYKISQKNKISRSNSFTDLINKSNRLATVPLKKLHSDENSFTETPANSYNRNDLHALAQTIKILQTVANELGEYPKAQFESNEAEDAFVRRQFDLRKYLEILKKSGFLVPIGKLNLNPNSSRPIFLIFNANRSLLSDNEKGPKRFDTSLYIRITKYPKSKFKLSPFQNLEVEGQQTPFSELPLCRYFVQATIYSSKLDIKQKSINIGTVHKNEVTKKYILIRNPNYIPLLYAIKKTGSISSGDITFKDYRYGIVRPFDERKIEFLFKPSLSGSYIEKIFVTNVVDFDQSQVAILKAVVLKTFSFHINELLLDYGIVSLNSEFVNLPIKYLAIKNTSTTLRTYVISIFEPSFNSLSESDNQSLLELPKDPIDTITPLYPGNEIDDDPLYLEVHNLPSPLISDTSSVSGSDSNFSKPLFEISQRITPIPETAKPLTVVQSFRSKKLSVNFLSQDYLDLDDRGIHLHDDNSPNNDVQKSIFDRPNLMQDVSLMHLSKEDLELIESLEQKIKIAKRKNKPEKVEKYIKKINALRGKNSLSSKDANIEFQNRDISDVELDKFPSITLNDENSVSSPLLPKNIKPADSPEIAFLTALDSLLSKSVDANMESLKDSNAIDQSISTPRTGVSTPINKRLSSYKVMLDGSVIANILPDSIITIPVSASISLITRNSDSEKRISEDHFFSDFVTTHDNHGHALKSENSNNPDSIQAYPFAIKINAATKLPPSSTIGFKDHLGILPEIETLSQKIFVHEIKDIDNVKVVEVIVKA